MADEVKALPDGTEAPDFTLKDQDGKDFTLSALKGKKVLLSFHPLAWTGVCAEQMKSLEANNKTLASLNTVAVGISVDSVPTKSAWAIDLDIKETRLLADFWPHGGVARLYGVFREQDRLAHRSNIVVDENGNIAFSRIYEMSQLPDIDEIISSVKELKQS